MFAEFCVDLVCLVGEFLLQWQDGTFVGRKRGREMQNRSYVVRSGVEHFLVVGVRQEGEHAAFHAERRLNDVGTISFVRDGIEVFHALPALVLVLGEVVIRSVCDAPQLAPAEREAVFEVRRRFGVEAEFFGRMVAKLEIFLFESE